MKKSILKLLSVILIASSLLCLLSSCKDEEEIDGYYVYGLHFDIGDGYNAIKVPYAENCYTNGESFFFFQVFSGEGIEETLGYAPDITVERYTQQFCLENKLDPYSYEYDSERDITTLKYVYEYDKSDEGTAHLPPEFYYHMIMRGTAHLYIITMTCDEALRETYEPKFDSWVENIYAD